MFHLPPYIFDSRNLNYGEPKPPSAVFEKDAAFWLARTADCENTMNAFRISDGVFLGVRIHSSGKPHSLKMPRKSVEPSSMPMPAIMWHLALSISLTIGLTDAGVAFRDPWSAPSVMNNVPVRTGTPLVWNSCVLARTVPSVSTMLS